MNETEHKDFYKKSYEDYARAYRKAQSALEAIGLLCSECRSGDIIRHLINTGKSKEL